MGKSIELPGTDFDFLFPGKYLKAADLMGKAVDLKIKTVGREEMPGDEEAVVLTFHDHSKAMVCNKTNGVFLKTMFGRDFSKWVGKSITLAPLLWNGQDPALRIVGSMDLVEDMIFDGKIGLSHVKKTLVATAKRRAAKAQTVQAAGRTVAPAALPAGTPPDDSHST